MEAKYSDLNNKQAEAICSSMISRSLFGLARIQKSNTALQKSILRVVLRYRKMPIR